MKIAEFLKYDPVFMVFHMYVLLANVLYEMVTELYDITIDHSRFLLSEFDALCHMIIAGTAKCPGDTR